MTSKLSRRHERADALAQTLAAAPIMRDLAEVAASALDAGLTNDAVRARVKAHAEGEGLASWRFLMPGLNRRMLRLPFPKVLRLLATYYSKSTRHKTLRDFIESFTSAMGFDDWVIDTAIAMARGEEPAPMVDQLFGGVHVQRMSFGGDEPTDVVIATAGPASDFEALAEQFLATCSRVYPPESWQRSETELRDARWARAFLEGRSDAEIAWDELARLHPSEIVHENPRFADEHKRKAQQIRQARKRWMDKVTKILDSSSPDSGTD